MQKKPLKLSPVGDKLIVKKIKHLNVGAWLLMTGADNQNWRDGQWFLLECYRVVWSNTEKIKKWDNVLIREMALIELEIGGDDYIKLSDEYRGGEDGKMWLDSKLYVCDVNHVALTASEFIWSFDKNFLKEVSRYDAKS